LHLHFWIVFVYRDREYLDRDGVQNDSNQN
jgi:hypothetical protein